MNQLKKTIEDAFEQRNQLTPKNASEEISQAVNQVLKLLDDGAIRVAEKTLGEWKVNQWVKKAVLLSFVLSENQHMQAGDLGFYDKVALKFPAISSNQNIDSMTKIQTSGVRVVPPAVARYGSFLGNNVVMMPSYVNIGAFVDEGTMIDTWVTVGSCAQIGKNVHLSGGVGIGGVLEPLQGNPTIIEDNCFIGARSEIVEGVIVEKNSVISMGVYIGQSTKILHRSSGKISYGRIPEGSVVVSGGLPSKDGSHSLYCAVIVKTVDEKTRSKVAINELLRDNCE